METNTDNAGLLNATQKKLVGIALGLLAVTLICFFLFGVFWLLREFVQTFSNVLWPLAVSGILALMLRPIVMLLEKESRLSRRGSIVILYGLVLVVIFAIGALVVPTLVKEGVEFIELFPEIIKNFNETLNQRNPEIAAMLTKYLGEDWLINFQQMISQNTGRLFQASLPAINRMGTFLNNLMAWSAGLAIIPVYLYFLLETNRDVSQDLRTQLSFLKEEWRDDAVFLIREFVGSIVAFFRGQILIAAIMGVLLSIGFALSGINFGIVLGLLLGFLNIIPYLGTIIGLAVVLPIAYFQPDGGLLPVGLALLVFTIVQIIEGYLLTPKIMGKTTGLHPMVIIIAIFFWGTALNGILGMILAIPLTAFFVVAWRLFRKKYFSEIREKMA